MVKSLNCFSGGHAKMYVAFLKNDDGCFFILHSVFQFCRGHDVTENTLSLLVFL
uniref:Uncharacterized protein n=1 Tax=Arundo donax TaxID=35708 RepID=A0A0A9DWI4_ARUDO